MRADFVLIAMLSVLELTSRGVNAAEEYVDYLERVKPILAERCYACHGALKQENGLRLDTAELAIQGGDSGPAITPGNADDSLLIQRVTAGDALERMPPEGPPLKPQQIAALRAWITQHAEAPPGERPEVDPRDHWAFRPIERPTVPSVANSAWVRNPIDAFVARQQEQFSLSPPSDAPREILVRRLFLDLIGLPPTESEWNAIEAETGDGWYEELVARLLDDPRYGERWARHWMDIWRYSDWWGLGDQLRNSQLHIWHWRDWIVESLNANMPYDEMVRLMLAADELHPNEPDKLRATGFLARNWALFGRDLWMEETVEHVAKGFLGLTMNCAKCHDHKFDPIPQEDFYRLRAFFEPYHVRMDMVPGEADLTRDGLPRIFDGALDVPTYRYERGQESQPDKSKEILPGVPEFLPLRQPPIQPVSLPKEAWQPERRPWVLETYVLAAQKGVAEAQAKLAEMRDKLVVAKKRQPQATSASAADTSVHDSATETLVGAKAVVHLAKLALDAARAELRSVERRGEAMRAKWAREDDPHGGAELADNERASAVAAVEAERRAALAKAVHAVADLELRLARANPDEKGALEAELSAARDARTKSEQSAAAPVTEADQYAPFVGAKWTPTRFRLSTEDDPIVDFPSHSSGRRTALAAWITDRRNPLTARVAVNHIWARHVGTPLVATVFDFGRKGSPPTHPELLDWLAAEFIDSGWAMKRLHRLIVTSSAYRMSSSAAGRAVNLLQDPDNLHLWRRTPMRLEAEVIRDSILLLAGTLDRTSGGPPVPPAKQPDSTRRSLYFVHSNNEQHPFLNTFDLASVKECYRRDQSIVPQQALALSNSGVVHDAARKLAERLSRPNASDGRLPDDNQFIRRAFAEVVGIRPNADEIHASMAALEAWRKLPVANADSSIDRARQNLVWALFNHNDFVTLR